MMKKTTQKLYDIKSLHFDEEDQKLFAVNDDLRLKADVLQNSLLPKLQLMLNHAISKIYDIYEIDVFDDSHISQAPSFRKKRDNDLKLNYNSIYCGLEGKRIKNKWHGAARPDGKEVQILPFKYTFYLDQQGLDAVFWIQFIKLSHETQNKFLDFLGEDGGRLTSFFFYSNFKMKLPFLLESLQENINWMKDNKKYDYSFRSELLTYPINSEQIERLIKDYSIFFYIYHSYHLIAQGLEVDKSRLDKLVDWAQNYKPVERSPMDINIEEVKERAAKELKVMPGRRWQVLKRDNWQCVSCGRASPHVILEADHIIPRSKGGSDKMDNMQTLCWECNIGKSNKDDTDLRNRTH